MYIFPFEAKKCGETTEIQVNIFLRNMYIYNIPLKLKN